LLGLRGPGKGERFPASFSPGDFRPLAYDRVRRVRLTIRQTDRARAFAHTHQPGSGRRGCWWSTSSRGAGVTASGVEQEHDQWALRPTSPATVTGRAVGAGAASLETRGKENRRGASTARRSHPERNQRSDAGDKTPAGRPQARASIVTIRPCLGHCICRPSDRLGRTDRGAEHDPVGAASWCPWITRVGPWLVQPIRPISASTFCAVRRVNGELVESHLRFGAARG
jgi:hypothetical protein